MIKIFDMNLEKTAELENAFHIQETQEINNIYSLSFQLPADDDKLQYCQGFHYAQYDEGEMYRIVKTDRDDNDTATVTISCEHVIATLCDDIMFGSFLYGGDNVHTREVIEWILNQQKTPRWTLGECDFNFEYEYGWEQENLLNALYSIPKQFVTPYRWTFDTGSLPWKVNLKAIDTMKEAFGLPVGYSDHTKGLEIPVAAVARGACVIEKHFTLDRNMEGPDHKASIEPDELKQMVDMIRHVEAAIGDGVKKVSPSELKNQDIARKSIIAKTMIKAGDVFSEENITTKRPGSGINPMKWFDLLGKRAKHDYQEDYLIEEDELND